MKNLLTIPPERIENFLMLSRIASIYRKHPDHKVLCTYETEHLIPTLASLADFTLETKEKEVALSNLIEISFTLGNTLKYLSSFIRENEDAQVLILAAVEVGFLEAGAQADAETLTSELLSKIQREAKKGHSK